MRRVRAILALILAATSAALSLPAPSAVGAPHAGSREAAASSKPRLKLDALFVGAHPDDEGFDIAALGEWSEYYGFKSGVVTITRGEGGGNAVGLQEGPRLGRLREGEERRAVGHGFVRNIFYPDKVDFYYTVSSSLTEELWGHRSSLAKIVRIIRETRPNVIITMDPAPSPGNHGNHQYSARLAIEAYYAAANPHAFRGQIMGEHLRPWRARKLFLAGIGLVTPGAVAWTLLGDTGLVPTEVNGDCQSLSSQQSTDNVYGVSYDRYSQRHKKSWGAVEADALHEYSSQGFSGTPTAEVLTGLSSALCAIFVLVDSRVPFSATSSDPRAVFEGASYKAAGGLPIGTQFRLTSGRYHVIPGKAFKVVAHARWGAYPQSRAARASLSLPQGWKATGSGYLGPLRHARETRAVFRVRPPEGTPPGRVRIGGTLRVGGLTGTTDRTVAVVPAVVATVQRLPQVAQFRRWARRVHVPQLEDIVFPVLSLGVGETRRVGVTLTNYSHARRSGTATLDPPGGFAVVGKGTRRFRGLRAGHSMRLRFRVRNVDQSLATDNDGGDYNFTVSVKSRTAKGTSPSSGSETAGLELVPVTAIPHAKVAPKVDGIASPGEYTGPELDLSRVWEGQPPAGPEDASGTGKVTWFRGALYFFVDVQDQTQGASLPLVDCKRHWRTDSVEITVDPRANSENTSTTFKSGILPWTDAPAKHDPPCFERDADNHQGPGRLTAPGMKVASVVSSPYRGYTVEAKVPFGDLPARVRPGRMGLNILIYDSDTQDKTGIRRLGWSTWGGVQGDPYRWGHAAVPGYTPPKTLPRKAPPPIVPDTALQSVRSPQSVIQSVRNGIPMSAGPGAPPGSAGFVSGPVLRGDTLTFGLRARRGLVTVYAWDGKWIRKQSTLRYRSAGTRHVRWSLKPKAAAALRNGGVVTVGYRRGRRTLGLVAMLTLGH